jgi:hypothetical protein
MAKLYYLGAPYSAPTEAEKAERLKKVTEFAARKIAEGVVVYSPLTHNGAIIATGLMPQGFQYWEALDGEMFKRCDALMVLKLPGWENSVGLKKELEWAAAQGKPVEYHEPA